jgi:hypothetical protein
VSGRRKIWANGLPNEGRLTKLYHRMAANGDTAPLTVGRWYDFHEFGYHLGKFAKVYFGAAFMFTNRPKGLKTYRNSHPNKLHRKIITDTVFG